jgi:hypothetical protein
MMETLWRTIEPVGAGEFDAADQRLADRAEQSEQHEGDEDREQRQRGAQLLAPQVAPDEMGEFHDTGRSGDRLRPELALVEMHRADGARGGVRIVRDHDDGLAVLAVERLEQVEDLVAGLAVEVAGRLVAEQERGIGDDAPGDADALLFAAGEGARVVLCAVREAHHRQGGRDVFPALGLAERWVSSSGSSTLRSAVSTGIRL